MKQVADVHNRVRDAESDVIARAVTVRVRLDALVDRVTSSGGMDAALLRELHQFLGDEVIPAAESYEAVIHAHWAAEGMPAGQARCPMDCWKLDLTCPQMTTFASVEEQLVSRGYVPHRNNADASVVETTLHCVCGSSLRYVGMRAEGSYRAFGVCGSCGHYLEF